MKTKEQTKIESDDRAVAIYHLVYEHEGFEDTAQILFNLVKQAQQKHPEKKRNLYLDIEGHIDDDGVFDTDMFELQNEFLMGFLIRFLAEIHSPLVRAKNQHPQENEIPPILIIQNKGMAEM